MMDWINAPSPLKCFARVCYDHKRGRRKYGNAFAESSRSLILTGKETDTKQKKSYRAFTLHLVSEEEESTLCSNKMLMWEGAIPYPCLLPWRHGDQEGCRFEVWGVFSDALSLQVSQLSEELSMPPTSEWQVSKETFPYGRVEVT